MKNLFILFTFLPLILGAQSYSLPFEIENPISTALVNQQILLEFNSAALISNGKMQNDCDDIRIVDAVSGGNALDFWIESGCNETVTRVWVKVPNIAGSATETVYMTYGDPSAISASDGEATFIFFDDFSSGTIDLAKWNIIANATIDNTIGQENPPSAQAQTSSANDNNLRSTVNLPSSNFALHASFYDNGISGSLQNIWSGIRGPENFVGVRAGSFPTYYYFNNPSYINTSVTRTTGWHYSEMQVTDCGQRSILDQGIFDSGWFGTSSVPTYFSLYSWNTNANFDDVFIRKLISDGSTCPEPIVIQGCETASLAGPGGVGTINGQSELVLWLKADAGVFKDGADKVNEWQDQSGHCHHVYQANSNNQPLYQSTGFNGNAGLLFDGVQNIAQADFMNNTTDNLTGSGSPRTIFVVGQKDASSSIGGTFIDMRRTRPNYAVQMYHNSGIYYVHAGSTNGTNHARTNVTIFNSTATPFVYTMYDAGAGSQTNLRLNGAAVALSQTGTVQSDVGINGFTVGLRPDIASFFNGQPWPGHIAEMIVYDRQLTAMEITDVEDYLNLKYNLSLPVELLSFRAKTTQKQSIQLSWQTASENNNRGFELQRSLNGSDFQNIHWVNGQGNSSEINAYQWEDFEVKKGLIYYYRLKQLDLDGSFTYSSIISAKVSGKTGQYHLFPNPVKDHLNIHFTEENNNQNVSIKIYNALGKLVLEKNVTTPENQMTLLLPALKGIHFVMIENSKMNILEVHKLYMDSE